MGNRGKGREGRENRGKGRWGRGKGKGRGEKVTKRAKVGRLKSNWRKVGGADVGHKMGENE